MNFGRNNNRLISRASKIPLNHIFSVEFNVKAVDELVIEFDCIIITVAHDEFKKMTLDDIKKFMNEKPVLIDVRGMFEKDIAIKNGFNYKTL